MEATRADSAVTPPATKWAEIDVARLRANARALASLIGDSCELMAMVKASGYGHGALHAAAATLAGGARRLGVSSLVEAVELRRAGIDAPILNTGWTLPAEMETAALQGVEVSVTGAADVAAARVAARRAGLPLRVHWKLDTGMGRLGTVAADVGATWRALREAAADLTLVGVFTHFAAADSASTDFTLTQHERFMAVVDRVRDQEPGVLVHCANSAAALRLPELRHDMVRAGIALYGYPPDHSGGVVDVAPALRFCAVVSQVKQVSAGDSVGYGREFVADRGALIAIVAAGYADGVDRRNGNRGAAILGGVLCPMVGRISMDQLALDVSAAGPVRSGDTAVLIGAADGLVRDAAAVAASIGTISYEVLCAVSSRVPRIAVNAGGD